jgi:hypothetical protein
MRTLCTLAVVGIALGAFGCEHRSWADAAKAREKADIPKVPYLVNSRSQLPEVRLWRDAERTDKLPTHKVAQGTKIAKILDSKEMPRTRGATMYKVRCVSGEEGWVPHFCVEYRQK